MPMVDLMIRTSSAAAHLRTTLPDEAAAIFAVIDADREHLREFLPWVDSTWEIADSLQFLDDSVQRALDEPLTWPAGIYVDGCIVGHASVMQKSNSHSRAEIGCWIASQQASRGLGTAVCQALIDHAFRSGSVHKMELLADTRNVRSLRIADRLGFTTEGTLREHERDHVHGGWRDFARFSLLRPEWEALQQSP